MTEDELRKIVQDYTGFPWFNGAAYADHMGLYTKHNAALPKLESSLVALRLLQDALRQEKQYNHSDKLRDVIAEIEETKGVLNV